MSYLTFMLFALVARANEFQIEKKYESFAQAKIDENNFLKFEIEAKKLGLFSSTVDGVAVEFNAKANWNKNSLTGAEVVLPVRKISTDLYARDDQMWNFCFEEKKFPHLKIQLPDINFSDEQEHQVKVKVFIRGEWLEAPLTIKVQSATKRTVSGGATWTFDGLKIPDPSIGIANVKNEIRVKFRLTEGI